MTYESESKRHEEQAGQSYKSSTLNILSYFAMPKRSYFLNNNMKVERKKQFHSVKNGFDGSVSMHPRLGIIRDDPIGFRQELQALNDSPSRDLEKLMKSGYIRY